MFYEDLQDLLEQRAKTDVLFIIGDWNAKVGSRDTWSNRQVWPWSTEWSRAKAYRVLPREPPGHSKHPLLTIPKKGNAKEGSNYCTIAVISHASKVMIKILQARLQQYMNWEHPDVQAGFRKGRGTRDQIANICWITEKAREFQKNIYFCFIDSAKAFDYVDHNKL